MFTYIVGTRTGVDGLKKRPVHCPEIASSIGRSELSCAKSCGGTGKVEVEIRVLSAFFLCFLVVPTLSRSSSLVIVNLVKANLYLYL